MQDRGHSGRVVTLSPPTSEAGVLLPAWPQVVKLVVACRWSVVYKRFVYSFQGTHYSPIQFNLSSCVWLYTSFLRCHINNSTRPTSIRGPVASQPADQQYLIIFIGPSQGCQIFQKQLFELCCCFAKKQTKKCPTPHNTKKKTTNNQITAHSSSLVNIVKQK